MIFKMYEIGELAPQERIAYFGWEGHQQHGLYNYIIGYKRTCELIVDEFEIAAKNGDIATQDTLIFPLLFNYRQVIELYSKYLYVKYVSKSEQATERYISEVGHDLLKAWTEDKDYILNISHDEKVVNLISDINNMIVEWDKFDESSFRMRYPMTKKNKATNPGSYRLDVINLKDEMNDLFIKMKNLDHRLCDLSE